VPPLGHLLDAPGGIKVVDSAGVSSRTSCRGGMSLDLLRRGSRSRMERYQRWATSTTMRLVAPWPARVKTRNGRRARTPSPIVV
jgi:hypothetical protein